MAKAGGCDEWFTRFCGRVAEGSAPLWPTPVRRRKSSTCTAGASLHKEKTTKLKKRKLSKLLFRKWRTANFLAMSVRRFCRSLNRSQGILWVTKLKRRTTFTSFRIDG